MGGPRHTVSRMIHQQPKKTLLQFPGLWLPDREPHHPWHLPSRSSRGLARRCCCDEVCPNCGGTTPDQFEVVITGVLPFEFFDCVNCNDLNDTYILDWSENNPTTGEPDSQCHWVYFLPSRICGIDFIWIVVDQPSKITVAVWGIPDVHLGWAYDVFDRPPCDELSDYDVAFSFWGGTGCDPVISTCRVTAL